MAAVKGVKVMRHQAIKRQLIRYGEDIIRSEHMQDSKHFRHHGDTNVYQHSIAVAACSLWLVRKFRWHVNEESLVRGALLHDYYLYDWHIPESHHRLHGFFHPGVACRNAKRDFQLNELEEDIIRKHMFPLTPLPPRYREGFIVCVADKIVSVGDYLWN